MKQINLALQGGGAHGAFTWGVLDRLLEEEKLQIAGISGTSAGAMNAIVLVNGFMQDGNAGAKNALECFWKEISDMGSVFQEPTTDWNLDWSLSYNYFDLLSRFLSPYALNPFNINPLREVLQKHLDVKTIQACSRIQLFIAATHVETGHARIFGCEELSVDAVLASACIPLLFQAVEIDGEAYWDGGYMGNPVLWPLIYKTNVNDILLVQINPLRREGTPMRSSEIINRLNEITFNSSLIAEMRAIHFVSKLYKENRLDKKQYRDMRMHMVAMDEHKDGLNASSKLNTRWEFFQFLKEEGCAQTEAWLKKHWRDIGEKSTIDIEEIFLKPRPKKNT